MGKGIIFSYVSMKVLKNDTQDVLKHMGFSLLKIRESGMNNIKNTHIISVDIKMKTSLCENSIVIE